MPPVPAPRLSLPRTAAALARYDAMLPELTAVLEAAITGGSIYGVMNEINQLGAEVGEAFGEDTSDRNDPQTCRALVRPDLWLRDLVAKYGPAATPAPHVPTDRVTQLAREWLELDEASMEEDNSDDRDNVARALSEAVLRSSQCDDPACKGWAHMNEGTNPSVQRCDECAKYPDDNAAQAAHDRECPDGAQCAFRGAQP